MQLPWDEHFAEIVMPAWQDYLETEASLSQAILADDEAVSKRSASPMHRLCRSVGLSVRPHRIEPGSRLSSASLFGSVSKRMVEPTSANHPVPNIAAVRFAVLPVSAWALSLMALSLRFRSPAPIHSSHGCPYQRATFPYRSADPEIPIGSRRSTPFPAGGPGADGRRHQD